MKTMSYRVAGRVQGVGFRAYAVRLARECRVVGWVRNDADGTLCRPRRRGRTPPCCRSPPACGWARRRRWVETLDAFVLDEVDRSPQN